MSKILPPRWLIEKAAEEGIIVEINDWKYHGDQTYTEKRPCFHKDVSPERVDVDIEVALNDGQFGYGQCKVCGKVIWCKFVNPVP